MYFVSLHGAQGTPLQTQSVFTILTTAIPNWKCLSEIAPQGHFLALRAQGATAPLGPRNDKSGGVCHFDGGLYGLQVHRREGHAPPLQWRVQSPRVPGNLQLPMAVTPRKGDAASVRRQSRQRLRSERRYRRNWLVRFCRQPVRIASACRIPIADTAPCAATHEKQIKFRKIPLFFCYGVL